MTIKLSDTQIVILSAACRRDDRSILPLPADLKGGAANKVIDSLIAKGLIQQAVAKRGEPVWRGAEGRQHHLITSVSMMEM